MGIKTRIVHKRANIGVDFERDPGVELEEIQPIRLKKLGNLKERDTDEGGKESIMDNTRSGFKPKLLKLLNVTFFLIFAFILIVNGFFIYQYKSKGYTPSQAFTGLARNSLQVADTVWEPELKNTNGYTGVLIMGIDSRELNFNGKEFAGKDRDIDTIMQIVVNNKTGDIFMLSIPRDTGVTVTEACTNQSRQYFKSINHIYKLSEDGNCPGGGVRMMQRYVTKVTGFENHYYAVISYQAFKDIVNAVGEEKDGKRGLYIDVPRNIQEYYPREVGGGFEAVYFPQGYQFIDSSQLLKYARSRKASSDFDRAKRQQQVVDALQQRITNSDTLTDPIKLYALYKSFQKNALFSSVSLDDIRGGVSLLDKVSEDKIYRLVLDDQFGGLNSLMTRPAYSGNGTHNRPGYYLSPVAYNDPECIAKKDEYCKVKEYLQSIYADPSLIQEGASIFAYSNITGAAVTNKEFEAGKAKFIQPISLSRHALPGREGWGQVQIYDFSGQKPITKKKLEQAFGVEVHPGSESAFKTNINKEDFVIIVKVN